MRYPELKLKRGRERSLLRRHPWVMSGAVESVPADLRAGETVDIVSAEGEWLARGAWSPQSAIRARVWSFERGEEMDGAFFRRRLEKALEWRHRFVPPADTAFRLVHGEADGLPGCIVDVYGDCAVCQFLSAGAEFWRLELVQALLELRPDLRTVYERSDTDARQREGLAERTGLLAGQNPPQTLEIQEGGLRFLVDVRQGHKTGFYLDQRENRGAREVFRGAEVLNCFCYSGGFGIRAAVCGAKHVTQVDSAASALDLARQNASLNHLPPELFDYEKADVFTLLRKYRDMGRSFDVVILDPPKFADTHFQMEKAARGYKDINLLGAKLTRAGGTLLTFSCSGAMTPELFQKVVGDATRDARRRALVVQELTQGKDHPLCLDFPEGRYLTGLELVLP
ncbi:MAG: class I SAM-dependent methyltransferase [Victivallales bacterium]|nr:class I SAM-dependent methyltransferase [Victivallales bacterium]